MTAREVTYEDGTKVAVVSTESVESPLSRIKHPDGKPRGAVYYKNVVRLVLADGNRDYVSCAYEGCEHYLPSGEGRFGNIQRIAIWHPTEAHGVPRRSRNWKDREDKATRKAMEEAASQMTVGQVTEMATRLAERDAQIKGLETKLTLAQGEIKYLRDQLKVLKRTTGSPDSGS
jgi:hypothetical protein